MSFIKPTATGDNVSAGSAIHTEIQLSHRRFKTDAGIAAHCHAVRYRLEAPVSPEQIQHHFSAALRRWRPDSMVESPVAPLPKLWIETVPAAANTDVAQCWRVAELRRYVEPSEQLFWRTVLLCYADTSADLILVAHRAVLDQRSLYLIGQSLICGEATLADLVSHTELLASEPSLPDLDRRSDELRGAEYLSRLDWSQAHPQESGVGRLDVRLEPGSGALTASLLAATALTVARYSNLQTPVVAAFATHPQRQPQAIGAYTGVTLIALPCSATASCTELLQAAAERIANPYPWYTPQLAEMLATESENSGTVLLGLLVGEDVADLLTPTEYLPCLELPFPLTITWGVGSADRETATLLYQQSYLDPQMAAQFGATIATIHRQLCANPQLPLAKIALLDPAEQPRITALGRSPRLLAPPDACIEQAYVTLALDHPDAPALSYRDWRLTYRELDEWANQVAHALRRQGVKEGDFVGICLERSVELVVMMLATLKAGATYVPIDPSYPQDRLAFTTSDARLRIVITSMANFPAAKQLRVLHLDEFVMLAQKQPLTAPNITASADSPAYVIYTSGSTGRPKGVVIPHRNVINLIAATRHDFQLGCDDTWTLFHSSAFDFSVWEIWGCLLTGGHLVVVPYWVSRSPEEFRDLLAEQQVTVLNQTPSAFAQLVEVDRKRPVPPSLRLVIFGGEPLLPRMLLPWFDHHPETSCRVVNMFGITETTVHVTAETITRADALNDSRSVGRALPGWHYYVMDRSGQLLPPGVAGEIYVGGAGVAQYYLNRPDLTTERFIPDPYNGGRMYRSGDKGRLKPDGRLEHLGRLDSQVKVRGFRIELDEIRTVLLETSGVLAAAVVLRQDNPADAASTRIDAYVVLDGSTPAEVRRQVSRVLPNYMVPATITQLDALPLTANGKLDLKQLPPPNHHGVAQLAPSEAPADELTALMLDVWRRVLGVPVGLDDNFFDLGGNSLYTIRLLAALRERNVPEVPMRTLYVHQTIRRFVAFLQSEYAR